MDKDNSPLSWSKVKGRLALSQKSTKSKSTSPTTQEPVTAETKNKKRLTKLHRRSIFFELLLLAAAICLGFGLTLPVVELKWLMLWTKQHSILDVIIALKDEKELFLAGVLFTFSVLFPVVKLLYLLFAYIQHLRSKRPQGLGMHHLHWLGKWSMLDVLVLALLVFYVKQTGLAEAQTLPAIYLFGGAVIFTMLATSRCEQHLQPL